MMVLSGWLKSMRIFHYTRVLVERDTMQCRISCDGAQQERSLRERKVRPKVVVTSEQCTVCICIDHNSLALSLSPSLSLSCDSHLRSGSTKFCGNSTMIWQTQPAVDASSLVNGNLHQTQVA